MLTVTPSQMRMIEDNSEKYGVSKERLMENAGAVIAEEILHHDCHSEIVFIVGTGNNGGDCLVSARLLAKINSLNITVIISKKPQTDLAVKMFGLLPESVKVIGINENSAEYSIKNADIIIDGVFGTGFHGELNQRIKELFGIKTKAYRIAVDVPSGAECKTGNVSVGTFKADKTLTLGCLKTGMTQYPLRDYCGKIIVSDIGIPEKAYEIPENERRYSLICYGKEKDIETSGSFYGEFLPVRPSDSHKGDFGKVLIIGGSSSMRGAGAMAVLGALKSGAGLVRLMSTEKCIDTVSVLAPEATFSETKSDSDGFMRFDRELITKEMKRADAVVIGCGMGITPDTVSMTNFVVQNAEIPVIIDADGINCIVSDINILLKKKTDIIITPHVAEMARLVGSTPVDVNNSRFETAEKFALEYGVTVVLKGAGTVVADNCRTSVNCTGNSGMSRGGSGDVLSGITGSFVARGLSPFDAACKAVYIHGLAGDIAREKYGEESMLPRNITDCLSDSFRKLKSR